MAYLEHTLQLSAWMRAASTTIDPGQGQGGGGCGGIHTLLHLVVRTGAAGREQSAKWNRPESTGRPQSWAWLSREPRFLCVLGNVTGWGPGDQGTGPWGAVGEYEVRYADGSRQVIPLITGRTVDDWLWPPAATDVAAVLRGSGWHLNLLVAALEAIAVRDLGTPSSPVVAAITIVP